MQKALLLLVFALFFSSLYAQNVGIGTNTPGTKLDVSGAITVRETAVAVVSNAATIPDNVSQVQLTGAATGTITLTAPSAPPNAGQMLIIYNNTTGGFGATYGTTTIPDGVALQFIYSNSGWVASSAASTGGNNYVQNQTTSPQSAGYNISGNATIGGTESVTGLVTQSGGVTETGTANINNSGAATTNIGVSGTGAVNIGNSTGGANVKTLTTAGIVTNTAAGTLGTTALVPVANGGTNAATAAAHTFFGNNTGSTAAPSFLGITAADLPSLSGTYVDLSSAQTAAGNKTWTGIGAFTSGTASTTTGTGAIVVTGGAGVSGNINAGGTVTAGGSAVMGTGIAGGYYQDVTNGAYRSIVSSATTNGYYFQTNGGASTTMYIGLGGAYNSNVGIGTLTPGQRLTVVDAGNSNAYSGTLNVYPQNLTQGVGIGYGGVSALAGSLALNSSGANALNIQNVGTGVVNIGAAGGAGTTSLNVTGYTVSNYFNSADNSVGSGVTGVMVKAGDNYHRTATAAALTTFLNTNNGFIQNQYSSAQSANLWISGAAQATEIYNNGWFRNNNAGTGLYNQVTGAGIYSPSANLMTLYGSSSLEITSAQTGSGNLRFDAANPYIYASSYAVMPGGLYCSSGTHYDQSQYQCRGGIHNDNAADLNIAGGTSATTNFSGPISGLSGNFPSNYMVRLTPNLHLNAGSGYAVIVDWDNGTTGTSQVFRIGNGAGSDAFDVQANGNTGISTTSPGNNKLMAYQSAGGAGSSYATGTVSAILGEGANSTGAYTFGVTGYDIGVSARSGGVHGAYSSGTWGALGYVNSGSSVYGAYFTSSATGTGYLPNANTAGMGTGTYGDFVGSWTRGDVIGTISAGELMAHYNQGNEFTSGHQADIVTVNNKRMPAYSSTSPDVQVSKAGTGKLVNGRATITFDENYAGMLDKESIPVVTVTPVGNCNGIHLVNITSGGFEIAENNGGNANVQFTYIVIGKRVDAASATFPADILDAKFDDNLKGVMFNEANTEQSAKPMWWDGNKIQFSAVPETLRKKSDHKPADDSKAKAAEVNQLIKANAEKQKASPADPNAPTPAKYPVVTPVKASEGNNPAMPGELSDPSAANTKK